MDYRATMDNQENRLISDPDWMCTMEEAQTTDFDRFLRVRVSDLAELPLLPVDSSDCPIGGSIVRSGRRQIK